MRRILLVAPDLFIRDIFKEIFTIDNYSTDIVENGKLALEKLRADTYELILIDSHDLLFVSGIDLIKQIRETVKNNIKIVVLSNLKEKIVIDKLYTLGIDGYEYTDLTPPEIVNKVKQYLNGEISKEQAKEKAYLKITP